MSKLTNDQVSKIQKMAGNGDSAAEISSQTGVTYATAYYYVKKANEGKAPTKVSKKKKSKVVEIDDTQVDAADDSEVDHKLWSEHWKDLSLSLIAQLIENNITPKL